MASATEPRRPGRPRLRRPPVDVEGRTAREQILDAAAALFVSQGLAATTTRQIAERVGIRQASLYYYFGGKDEMLLELLTESVRPSLRVAEFVELDPVTSPGGKLYALAVSDVRTLARAPHNIGTLYLSPEVQDPAFASFRAERLSLQEAYERLGVAAGSSFGYPLTGVLLMQLVESVIQLRRLASPRDAWEQDIAESCLGLAGLVAGGAARARADGEKLLANATP